MDHRTCKDCGKNFLSKATYVRCRECHLKYKKIVEFNKNHHMCIEEGCKEMIKYDRCNDTKYCSKHTFGPEKPCQVCTKSFRPSKNKVRGDYRNEKDIKCVSCFGKSIQKCSFCGENTIADSYYTVKCRKCTTIVNALASGKYDSIKDWIDPNFLLKITYKVTTSECNEYCPDHTDSLVKFETYTYPLLKDFTNADIDQDGDVLNWDSDLMRYYPKKNDYNIGCCDAEVTYEIQNIFVVKNERKIDLGR